MSRRILITGAAGFLGSRVALLLSQRGFCVTGLDRVLPPTIVSDTFAEFFHCDLLNESSLGSTRLTQSFDVLVHLAGALPGKVSRNEMFAVNVGGTSALLERFAAKGCHVVFLSTGLVYGVQPGPFQEDLPCLALDPYAQSKLAAECITTACGLATDSLVTHLRASVLYGPRAPSGMLLCSLLEALRKGQPFAMTSGEQRRDFLHVDDAAQAVAAIVEQRAPGTFNLGSGESSTIRETAELAASIADRADLLRPGALAYRPNEVFDYRLDSSALRLATGWTPRINLAEGLRHLWNEEPCFVGYATSF